MSGRRPRAFSEGCRSEVYDTFAACDRMLTVGRNKEDGIYDFGVWPLIGDIDDNPGHARSWSGLDSLDTPDAIRVVSPQRSKKRIHRIDGGGGSREELWVDWREGVGVTGRIEALQLQRLRGGCRALCRGCGLLSWGLLRGCRGLCRDDDGGTEERRQCC